MTSVDPALQHPARSDDDDRPLRRKIAKPGERKLQILQTLASMLEHPKGERITTAALAKRLDACCPPKVVEAKHGDLLVNGTVYIGPGGMHVRVTPTSLRVEPDKGESLYKPSVDVLAESALAAFGKHVLGVMLTGMGNDGMKEFVKLHRAGAYNLVQDQESCVVYGMPRAVADAGGADEVLPLEKIGLRIRAMLKM